MGFFDEVARVLDPYGGAISNAVGKVVDATTSNGDTQSGLTATPATRKALVQRILKGKNGQKQLAYFLKDRGYAMSIAGPEGFRWATHGFLTLGDDTKQIDKYNQAWMKVKHPPAPAAPNGGIAPPVRGGKGGAGTGGAGGGGGVDTSAADSLVTDVGGAAPPTTDYGAMLNGLNPNTAALLKPRQYAKNQAGLAFDPKIAELTLAQKRQGPQARQNQANIASWYGQVGQQQKEGIAATKASNEQVQQSLGDVGANLVRAAGGNETAGGLVGASTATGAATLGAVGASNEALAGRLKELTSLEGKTKGIDEQRYQAKLAADMALELSNTKGQKGAAFADALSKALEFNNSARQTNFANRLSSVQTRIGADAAGVNLQAAQLGLAGDKVDLAGKILTYKQAQQTLKSGGRVYWNKMAPEARAGLVNAAVGATLGKKGNPIAGALESRKRAYNWAVQTAGINNPAFRSRVDAELKRRFPNWYTKSNK